MTNRTFCTFGQPDAADQAATLSFVRSSQARGTVLAILSLTVLCLGIVAGQAAAQSRAGGTPAGTSRLPTSTPQAVVLKNDCCRFEIGLNGRSREFVNLAQNQDVNRPDTPFMLLGRQGKTWPSSEVALAGDLATVSFGDSGVRVKVQLAVYPKYFTVTVNDVSGGPVDWVQLCNLRVTVNQNIGALVNAAWDDRFAVCVLACNDRTDCGSAGVLTARAHAKYGLVGAKAAILGVPTGSQDPAGKLLDAIETVELGQGLPHPTINGAWIKRAPERFNSYLMVSGATPQNIDQVIEFAKGGFGCIELDCWKSTPTYEPNPRLFPDGLAGFKKVTDKIHAAGLQVGLHMMQGMVGWGAKTDPYITPKADPRLLQDHHAVLAKPLDAKATEIAVQGPVADWPEAGDLYLEGEIVRYAKRTDAGFAECQRGLHGTTVTAHAQGSRVGHLVNCFPIWGHTVYCPDVNTTMIDEICQRIARVFDETGADMSYFDGGEEVAVQPPHWRNQGRIALGVQSRVRKPVFLGGNAIYTHLAWHVITRGSPHYDPIYFGRRYYTLRFKGQNPAGWAKNLLSGDVGWFAPHTHSLTTDAVTPDELMLLCLKAVGGKSPISFSVSAANLQANKRMPEMLEIIRTCDDLKRRNYFSEAACAELARPMAEHVLERAADGGWDLRPLQFGPPCTLDARSPERREWTCTNPYQRQTPWMRIRGRTALSPYGSKNNIVLAGFEQGVSLKPDGTASPELVQSVEPCAEKAPDGTSAFCYRAENRGKAASGWCRLSLPFAKPLDLTKHRRLGLWLRSEGKGGILNVQLTATDARRDHYIALDRPGWRYYVLDVPEDARFYDYRWPYRFTDLLYTCWPVYHRVKELNLYCNGLPAGSKMACWIGRIEALEERALALESPTLESAGQKLRFPVRLKPDEYVEMDWSGACRHFDPNGGVLGHVKPEGTLCLVPGDNKLRFTAAAGEGVSGRAEVILSLRGAPLPNARRVAAKP